MDRPPTPSHNTGSADGATDARAPAAENPRDRAGAAAHASASADASLSAGVSTPAAGVPLSAPGERPALATLPRGPLVRQALLLALPMLGEQFLSFLVGLVDTYLAGGISKEATVAVGTGSYLTWFSMTAFMMVGIGAAALVSRSLGAGDAATADRGMNQAMRLALLIGVLATGLAWLLAPALSSFLTDTPAARDTCASYLRIVSLAFVLTSVHLAGGAVLRAAGDTLSPMRIMIVVNVVNVVLSAGLVHGWYGLRLGVDGIAYGTLAARCVGGVLMILLLLRGRRGMRLSPGRPDWPIVWRILRVGLPAAADTGFMTLAQLLFIKVVVSTGERDAATANFAAHTIAMQVEALCYLPALALGTSAATLVGQYLGAGRPEVAARAGHTVAGQGLVWGVLVAVVFALLAAPIYALMSNDPAVHAVGVPAFRILAVAQPFLCVGIIYISALRGAGDTRTTLWMTLICGVVVRVPLAWLLGVVLEGGLIGAWCGMWADNVLRCGLAAGRFVHGGWKRIRV